MESTHWHNSSMESTSAPVSSSINHVSSSTNSNVTLYANAIVGVLTVFTNVVVIIIFLTQRKIRKVHVNIYTFYLAISDFFVGVSMSLSTFIWGVLNYPELPRQVCDVWTMTRMVSLSMSALMVILLSYDRYKLVQSPIKYHLLTTASTHRFILTFIFTFICLQSLIFVCDVYLEVSESQDSFESDEFLCYTGPFPFGLILVTVTIINVSITSIALLVVNVAFVWKLAQRIRDLLDMTQGGRRLSTRIHINNIARDNDKIDDKCTAMVERNTSVISTPIGPKDLDDLPNDRTHRSSYGLTESNSSIRHYDGSVASSYKDTIDIQSDKERQPTNETVEATRVHLKLETEDGERYRITSNHIQQFPEREIKRLKSVATKLATYVVVFAISWIPFAIATCLPVLGIPVLRAYNITTIFLVSSNSLVNPLLYFIIRYKQCSFNWKFAQFCWRNR